MIRRLFLIALLSVSSMMRVAGAPFDTVSGTLPYTFTASCADPVGENIIFGITTCNSIDIDYTATGGTSLFANASLSLQTFLDPELPGPFPFTGSFVLANQDNPAETIFGTLVGAGTVAGPPGPPIGFPPFVINALLTATGGTGQFSGATGSLYLTGPAIFTAINANATFASGEGSLTLSAVPEPGSGYLMAGAGALAWVAGRRRVGRLFGR